MVSDGASIKVERDDSAFEPLFNGKDLSGWKVDGGDAAMWGVENGAIIARGQKARTRNYLLTDREYSDFVLRLEFNLEKSSGSGLSVRAIPGEQMPYQNGSRNFDHPLFKLIDSPGREETGTTHWIRDSRDVKPDQLGGVEPERFVEPRGARSHRPHDECLGQWKAGPQNHARPSWFLSRWHRPRPEPSQGKNRLAKAHGHGSIPQHRDQGAKRDRSTEP